MYSRSRERVRCQVIIRKTWLWTVMSAVCGECHVCYMWKTPKEPLQKANHFVPIQLSMLFQWQSKSKIVSKVIPSLLHFCIIFIMLNLFSFGTTVFTFRTFVLILNYLPLDVNQPQTNHSNRYIHLHKQVTYPVTSSQTEKQKFIISCSFYPLL